jgi:hypothetical protein
VARRLDDRVARNPQIRLPLSLSLGSHSHAGNLLPESPSSYSRNGDYYHGLLVLLC